MTSSYMDLSVDNKCIKLRTFL